MEAVLVAGPVAQAAEELGDTPEPPRCVSIYLRRPDLRV